MRSRIETNENLSGRSVEVNGATLYYKEHGDGAPLILIHGGLSTSSQWEPVVPEIVANHPGAASALIVGAPDPAQLGEFADDIKALHPRGAEQRRALVRQTARCGPTTRA